MKKIYMIGKPLQECRYEREVSLVDVLIRGGGGHGNPLHYSCLENPMDRGTWRATVHRVARSWARLSKFTFTSLSTASP